MNLFAMRGAHVLWTPLAPEEIERTLGLALSRTLTGKVEEDHFELQYHRMGRNSWRPRLRGTWMPHAGGTLVEIDASPHPFVVVFTAVHAIPFLGLSWLLGVAAFASELYPGYRAIEKALGAVASGAEEVGALPLDASPPEADGAEAHAPWCLRARPTLNTVQFRLRAAGVFRAAQVLSVSAAGLHFTGASASIVVPWQAVRSLTYEGRQLFVGTDTDEHVLTTDQPDSALAWLVAYLDARRQRYSTAPETAAQMQTFARGLQQRRETE